MPKPLTILCVGDVFGEPGRRAVQILLPRLRKQYEVDLAIVNVENSAGGFGVTPQMARAFLEQGVDVMTSGNHIWDKKEIIEHIAKDNLLLRPANFPAGTPGTGYVTVKAGPHNVAVQNLHGKPVADKVLAEVKAGVAALKQRTGVEPTLAVILVGEDPASQIYVRNKKRAADEVGIASRDFLFPQGCTQAELLDTIRRINADAALHGILLQLPLPKGMDEDQAVAAIAPQKDADGLHPMSLGNLLGGKPTAVPCTPAGCIEILDHYGIPIEGAEAVMVGRSRLVGKPLAQLLLARNATVTMCHTRTRDLAAHCRRADILCVAAGRPHFITGDMVKAGAVIIDVGVNRLDTGKLAGDVDFESASQRARAITPVPGGVGPMTVAMLMKNTLLAATRQLGAA